MNHNLTTLLLGVAALPAAAALLLPSTSEALEVSPDAMVSYEITVTNLTATQIFSPPLVASHSEFTRMFVPGDAASSELATLAEEGDFAPLMAALMADPEVLDTAAFPGMIMPGDSASVTVSFDVDHQQLSIAGMLVTTNDGFFALDAVPGMGRGKAVLFAPVWDAGSEANSEDCAYIPGPPCGAAGMHDPAPAEGFIHLHSGIHGGASLDPAVDDWGIYAARIEIERL